MQKKEKKTHSIKFFERQMKSFKEKLEIWLKISTFFSLFNLNPTYTHAKNPTYRDNKKINLITYY